MRHKHLILLLLPLAACATPEQQCRTAATQELRTVDLLIIETSQNIERGFAIQQEVVPRVGFNYCFGNSGNSVGVSFCSGGSTAVRDRPVAIDPAAERAKLDQLQARRAALVQQSQASLSACDARFGG